MKLSSDLTWRGLIKDKTFADVTWLDKPQTFYHGIDASTDSMTIGNLAAMLLARRMINAGWQAVLVAGGATSLIGDPGGKTQERELKPREEIQKNIEAIKRQINKLFAGQDFLLVDNYEWLKDVRYLDFLREVGKSFSMTELMQREFVKERMGGAGSGISYAEFSYSLAQGYDFWYLFKNYQVVLQIGGSDQWANMLSGVSLIRKKEGKEAQALSMPLVVNKTTGVKFGKSEGGTVWLDPQKTSPTQFYQFWINTDDADVGDYLKIFTFLPKDEIERLMKEHKKSPGERIAQAALAEHVTTLVHGAKHGLSATSVTYFLKGSKPLSQATEQEIDEIRIEIPSLKAKAGALIVDCLKTAGLAASKTEARRLLSSGAIYINGRVVDRELLAAGDFENGRLLLRRGKAYKDSALIEQE